jgi:hypothetical protein
MHRRHAVWFLGMLGCSFDSSPRATTDLGASAQDSAQMVARVVRDGGQPMKASGSGGQAFDSGDRDAAITTATLQPLAAGKPASDPAPTPVAMPSAGTSGANAATSGAAAPQAGASSTVGNPASDSGMPPNPPPPPGVPGPTFSDPSATLFINQLLIAVRSDPTNQNAMLVAWLNGQASAPDIDTASGLATLLMMIGSGVDCSTGVRQPCLLACQWTVSRCNVCMTDDACLSALQQTCGQTTCARITPRSP